MRFANLAGVLFLILVFQISGCSSEDAFTGGGYDNEDNLNTVEAPIAREKISQNGSTISHTDNRRGRNCMDCHFEGNNPYIYTVAGTVYQLDDLNAVYPDATIKLYSDANGAGTLLATIEVDSNGNFYTTQPMDFSGGVYPVVEGNAGEPPIYMGNFVTTGRCNSCHGTTTLPIYLEQAPPEPTGMVSQHGLTLSHTDDRRGTDCLDCHSIGGNNPNQFSVAGTVYELNLQDFYADATVSLYDGPNGSGNLIATIEVDGNGNFYTTESIDLGNGVYPAVTGREISSPTLYMNVTTSNGGCNSCHGVNRPSIFTQ